MENQAYFKVDPKLATLLGEGYRSTEHAVKELVDNAWDADASHVWITLPDPLTGGAIVVKDDGAGMTPQEVQSGYLLIASDRCSRKGDTTPGKRRQVKGRKGIGKFAGLMAASVMEVETKARGVVTRLRISRDDIVTAGRDLERIPLPFGTEEEGGEDTGTTVTLSDLNQNLSFPSPERLREILVYDYGREEGFTIVVNGAVVGIEDVPGRTFTEDVELDGVGRVRVRFTVADGTRRLKQSGLVVRVNGKVIGAPVHFGLEDDETVPRKLLGRVYGEVVADGLADDVTADWGAIVENSKAFQTLRPWVKDQLKAGVEERYARDVQLQKARIQQEVNRRLAELPENRREFARRALERVLRKFYGESDPKVNAILSVILEAFEKDEYWVVLQEVSRVKRRDVEVFAEALESFGLTDIAYIARQAQARLRMLDGLEDLVCNADTLEKEVHKVLEANLWVFGPEYALMASNQTTRRIIREYVGREFSGERANKRPDLLMAKDLNRRLLVELKRPAHAVTRDDEAQARKYRDDLAPHVGHIGKIIVVGGRVAGTIDHRYEQADVELTSFDALIENARAQLDWLIDELTVKTNRSEG